MIKQFKRRLLRHVAEILDAARSDTSHIPFGSRGQGVRINRHVRFVEAEGMILGNYIYIGPHCFFSGSGGLTIHDNVAIGPMVYVYTSNHRYDGQAEFVPFDEHLIRRPVCIESHCWIGGNSVIVPGVTVHEGAIVAAGSVVTHDVPRCAVVGGNPAKVLKYRDIERFDRLVAEGKFFEQYEFDVLNAPRGF